MLHHDVAQNYCERARLKDTRTPLPISGPEAKSESTGATHKLQIATGLVWENQGRADRCWFNKSGEEPGIQLDYSSGRRAFRKLNSVKPNCEGALLGHQKKQRPTEVSLSL